MVSSFGGGGGGGGAMKVSQVHNSIPSAAGGTQEGRVVMRGGSKLGVLDDEGGRGEVLDESEGGRGEIALISMSKT